MKIEITIIHTTGERETHEVEWSKFLGFVHEKLGTNNCDTSAIRHQGNALATMFVDGDGWEYEVERTETGVRHVPTNPRLPINVEATEIYRANHPGSDHTIVGTVAIVPEPPE